MPDSILSSAEQILFRELNRLGVRFMVVGMSAALLQGARGATEAVDLWFEDTSDPRISEAVRAAGGIWVSGSFGMAAPRIGGSALGDRFDVVTHMSGLGNFATEYTLVIYEMVDGLAIPLLPLEQILASKRAADRPKDRAIIVNLEDTLAVLDDVKARLR
jgi:hypothetical protein